MKLIYMIALLLLLPAATVKSSSNEGEIPGTSSSPVLSKIFFSNSDEMRGAEKTVVALAALSAGAYLGYKGGKRLYTYARNRWNQRHQQ